MKTALAAGTTALTPVQVPWQSSVATVAWKSSTAGRLWHDEVPLTPTAAGSSTPADITVDPTATYQRIAGWGGCFNERGWKALAALSPAAREKVLRSLFDPADGLKLTLCRSPIGASDYAITPYSLDDTANNAPDYDMAHFSIARDRQMLIPFIQAAMAIQPALKLWGVPWSPPAWMKTNGLINTDHDGRIKADPKTLAAYALYFEKYIRAYQGLGLQLFMVAPQNEPTQRASYPSCLWTGTELRDFLITYLGPRLARDHIDCQAWLGTPTNGDPATVEPTLRDPQAAKYVKGYGLQYSAWQVIPLIHRDQPAAPIMETETPCGHHENDWPYAEDQFKWIKTYLDAGAEAYMLWNMVLDQDGSNWDLNGYNAGWRQNSPVVIDVKTGKVTYTPQYEVFRHFSSFVRPGAHRVEVAATAGEAVAFRNPDGGVVLVVQNRLPTAVKATMNLGGRVVTPTLAPHSWNTFTLAGH